MTRTIELTEEQKKLFVEALTVANQAGAQAQAAVDFANMRRKSFEDLMAMYCLSNKLKKEKVKLDPQTWTIVYEEEEKVLTL